MNKSRPVEPGTRLLPLTIPSVSAEAMADLAEILRDPNPIHLDPAAVMAAGLGNRRINQGPANMAYVMNMLASALPDAELKSMSIAFTANACEGDCVTAHAEVTRVATQGDATEIDCTFELSVADARPALKGSARLAQPATLRASANSGDT